MSEETSVERYDTAHFMDNLCRVMRNYDLSWGEMGMLGCLIRHDCPDPRYGGNRKGEVWPSPDDGLQEMTEKDPKVLRRLIKSLAQKGLITCLTPERSKGGRGQVHHWRPNYTILGWKFPEAKPGHFVQVYPPKPGQNVQGIRESDSESGNPPPPNPPPSSRPAGSPAVPSMLEEEEFPFLSPDEWACLQSLQVSPALGQRVRQSAPGVLQAALQHLLTHREDILTSGHSLEERFGGLLRGTFVPSPEREIPSKEEVVAAPWCLCQTCGVTYQGEHDGLSSPEGKVPGGGRDLWLQEMRQRVEAAQQVASAPSS